MNATQHDGFGGRATQLGAEHESSAPTLEVRRHSGTSAHISSLDGLRGLAALWVLTCHTLSLTGISGFPVLSWGGLAVDLFMMLSGFLMAHHYILRREAEPWERPSTWMAFWVRRFFRIAPLYYLLLVTAILTGPLLGEYRDTLARLWPATTTPDGRYYDQSIANILMHFSFAFGASPTFSFRTSLPDWSIGLEMQFYLVFPFLMLATSRLGSLKAGTAIVAACAILVFQFKGLFAAFPMPSFLPVKMYAFFIGIWMAQSERHASAKLALYASLLIAILVCAKERTPEGAARVVMVFALFCLIGRDTIRSGRILSLLTNTCRTCLSLPLARSLGDLSYGVYLIHLLVLVPVAGALARHARYLHAPAIARFAICFAVVAPVAYFSSWVLHYSVEKPGNRLGKSAAAFVQSIWRGAKTS